MRVLGPGSAGGSWQTEPEQHAMPTLTTPLLPSYYLVTTWSLHGRYMVIIRYNHVVATPPAHLRPAGTPSRGARRSVGIAKAVGRGQSWSDPLKGRASAFQTQTSRMSRRFLAPRG